MYPSKARRRQLKALTTDIGLEDPIPGTTTYGVYCQGMSPWQRGHLTPEAAERDAAKAEQVTGIEWSVDVD